MTSEVAVNRHQQHQQEVNRSIPHQSEQPHPERYQSNPEAPPIQTVSPSTAPQTTTDTHTATTMANTNSTPQIQGISTAITTTTAVQAAAAAAAAGRDMKNFSDLEINELLGLIPDEYTAEQQAAEEAAAANAAAALGKGVHHTVTVTGQSNSTIRAMGIIRRASSTNTEGQQQNVARNPSEKAHEEHIAAQEAQIRSERKRSREKQRRNDVNKQFAELTEVLKNIEREAQEVGRNDDAYGSVSTMMAIAASTGPTNRVDLIARTIVHLERLNRTAKKQRVEISSLREQLERTKKAGEEMAEKLKDIMFNQQRHYASTAFAPYPQLAGSSGNATVPTPSAPGVAPMAAPSGVPQHHPLQQQMPMMMMPMMMPPPTAQAPASSAPTGAPGPAPVPGVSAVQQHQPPQQQFMMVMSHPGSQVAMAGQPMHQMMQPMAPVQQHLQPATQHQPQVQVQQRVQQQVPQQQVQQQVQQQMPQQQQQTYAQQQQPMQPQQQQQQQQPIAPASQQAPAGQGSSSGVGGGVTKIGENFAHAA